MRDGAMHAMGTPHSPSHSLVTVNAGVNRFAATPFDMRDRLVAAESFRNRAVHQNGSVAATGGDDSVVWRYGDRLKNVGSFIEQQSFVSGVPIYDSQCLILAYRHETLPVVQKRDTLHREWMHRYGRRHPSSDVP